MVNRLEAIFEPEFDEANFGYRKGRSTKDALRKIWLELEAGYEWVVDADLKDFFGSVDHAKLLGRVVNYRAKPAEANFFACKACLRWWGGVPSSKHNAVRRENSPRPRGIWRNRPGSHVARPRICSSHVLASSSLKRTRFRQTGSRVLIDDTA